MTPGETYGIILALLFAVAAGLVGSFALMKRKRLARANSRLPRGSAGYRDGISVWLQSIARESLPCSSARYSFGNWQKKTGLATEAMIGVVFAASLAIGAVLTPQEDQAEASFGRFQELSLLAFLLGLGAVLADHFRYSSIQRSSS